MDFHPEQFFSEPSGWANARISFGGGLSFVAIYAYFELLYGSGLPALLIIGVAMTLSGIAEVLPKNRRRAAIVFRVTAIGILVVLVVRSVVRVLS
ncbi:hypothetical protein [Halopiger xanaduensis]|uniref:Uncharacterized protein n=1 Tax=Halopiger xanaduensis (strain DSM 18323 / JCM 14033 / SH-6) TaxID=797210 RepID=F8D2U9_HALXS|nr:hypothetical protein [Halopiger xanaduensis]AEH36092.1 hypothetical protein Halxa_1459 [Halopiger xanaduensis SH-6]